MQQIFIFRLLLIQTPLVLFFAHNNHSVAFVFTGEEIHDNVLILQLEDIKRTNSVLSILKKKPSE